MNIEETLNDVLVRLFKDITTIEEKAMRDGEFKEISVNDMHIIDAIHNSDPKNMTTVARYMSVTTGTLTIAVNALVYKGYVVRERSEEDRRVVYIYLTEKGERAYERHAEFHKKMINGVLENLSDEEKDVLQKALGNLNNFFSSIVEARRDDRFSKSGKKGIR